MKLTDHLRKYLKNRKFHKKYQQCYAAATQICTIGFHNGKAQSDLNAAKDALYRAAQIFLEEASL